MFGAVDKVEFRTRRLPIRAFPHGRLLPAPGLSEDRRQEVVRQRPLTGVCRRRRSSARHSCRVPLGQRHGARPVDGPSRWDGLQPDGLREGIKMSRNYDGERWQSGSNGSRRVRNRPKRRHREKPRERGLRFAAGSKPRPDVNAGSTTAYGGEGPSTGLYLSRFPNAACRPKQKVVHVYNLGKVHEFVEKQWIIFTLLNNMRAR